MRADFPSVWGLNVVLRLRRAARCALFFCMCIGLGVAVAATSAPAQDDGLSASYVTPFPENDTYRVQVLGDFMAEGLFSALSEALSSDPRVQMPRRLHTLAGLMRFEPEDFAKFEDAIGREPLHIAVVMFGIGDRIPLRAMNGRRVAVGSDEWKAEYSRRVDRLLRALKRRGAAVYWVGLPIVRRPDMNDDVQMLNSVFRERALLGNVKFIDIYEAFADEAGSYNQYGPDLTGKTRLLREGDGVAFTGVGSRKLAHFVEREIKRDLTQAKNDRNIPLAGSEVEQRRIAPRPQQPAAPVTGWGGSATPASPKGKEGAAKVGGPQLAGSATAGQGELKAETSKVAIKVPGRLGREETVMIDIVRPAIPASVVALVSRSGSPERLQQLGDNVPDTLPGGTPVLNSITPGLAAGSSAQRRRLAPTQSPFFRVLVKGERLQPKRGRADDFAWPRPDADVKAAEEPSPGSHPATPSRPPAIERPPRG